MIDERNPDDFTDADWRQACQELMGAENNTPPEETPDNADLTEEWSVIAGSRGHRIPRPGTEEEETIGEQCVVDGLEEAAPTRCSKRAWKNANKKEKFFEPGL